VIDLDSASRVFAFQNPSHPRIARLPAILAFFDFAAAFPSVFHQWIFLVLEYRGFPSGFIDFIRSLYFLNAVYYCSGDSNTFLYWIASGVLQGCPASAFLFDCALDPFLEAFSEVIGQDPSGTGSPAHIGIIRACADDIGAALLTIVGLKYLEPIFHLAPKLAGLTLKPAKCVVVPISAPLDDNLARIIKEWLAQHIPCWKNFKIQSAGKYLGIVMGPRAGALQWKAPMQKFRQRAQAIGSTHAPLSIASHLYNVHAVSVLLYVAQLCKLPDNLEKMERKAIHCIWHFATNALTTASFLNLFNVGGPRLRSVVCSTMAAQFRAAWKFKSIWQAWITQIRTTMMSHGNLSQVASNSLSPEFWDSPPIALVLSRAWEGGPIGSSSRGSIDSVKNEIWKSNLHGMPVVRMQIQGMAAKELMGSLYPSDIASVLQRRLRRILGSVFNPGSLASALQLLHELKPFQVMQVIKTWSNAWATTHRFHESGRLPCLLGCPNEPDSLDHYAFCARMQSIIVLSVTGSAPSPHAPLVPSSMELGSIGCRWNGPLYLGLDDPCRLNFQCVASMFYAYHAIKFTPEVKDAAGGGIHTLDFTSLQLLFAGAFEAAFRFA